MFIITERHQQPLSPVTNNVVKVAFLRALHPLIEQTRDTPRGGVHVQTPPILHIEHAKVGNDGLQLENDHLHSTTTNAKLLCPR